MKRVIIIGSGGAGKSTLARRLGRITGLEVIHLDALHWLPGWQVPPKNDWFEKVEKAIAGESWIMDGNFGATMEIRLAACDTVVFLDLPRLLCLYRVVKRRFVYRGTNRPDMAEGCREQIDLEFLRWIWTFPQRAKPEIEERLARLGAGKTIYHLRSPREVDDFLARVSFERNNL